jgi:hypothetical protein
MSEAKKEYKYTKIGNVQKSKPPYDKNPDGSDKLCIKVDKTVTLREGEYISLWVPKNENAPEYVIFDVMRKNSPVV